MLVCDFSSGTRPYIYLGSESGVYNVSITGPLPAASYVVPMRKMATADMNQDSIPDLVAGFGYDSSANLPTQSDEFWVLYCMKAWVTGLLVNLAYFVQRPQ